MRKFAFVLMLAISFTTFYQANAQKVNACGFIIPPKSLRSNFKSVYEAADIVKSMIDTIGWKENFKIKEQNGINNAYATMVNQVRYIVYDNEFLENLDAAASTKWASISVLAHEIGHHYFNHVVKNQGSNVPSEIEADKFSGYVMQRLGATLDQAKAAMSKLGTPQQTSTHPAKADRLKAITSGWELAKTQKGTVTTTTGGQPTGGVVKPPSNPKPTGGGTPPANPTPTDPNNDPSWIALYFQSNKEETVQLSDDGRTFQPAVVPIGQAFVFKFEIYNYGFLKLPYYNGYRSFKLEHGKDYSIIWNRRTKNYTVVEIPQ